MKTITPKQAHQLIIDGEAQTHEQRKTADHERLQELVLYAKEHSPYFKEAYKNIDTDFKLEDLPVTIKADLMKCYDLWPTDPEVTEKSVREYLSDVENVSESYLGRYTALSTSGTTGAPMPFVRDSYHNILHACMMNQRLLREIDAEKINFFNSKTAAIVATDGFVSSYSSAMRMKKRLGEKADILQIFSILTPLEKLIEQLNDFQPEIITGYPSVLSLLVQEKLNGKLTVAPYFIASSAEKMTSEVYALLRKAFNCPVLNNYCSTEGGEIAMSCREGHLHLNDDWILLEPVNENMQAVSAGEWSTGVLVTDLTNYIQPIIRYHVNDCVRFSEEPCACGISLPILEISGRMGDTLCLNGTSATFPVVYFMLVDVSGLLSWQLIQNGNCSVELRFKEAHDANRADVAVAAVNKLKEALRAYGCGEVEVTVSDECALKNPRGGKTPHIVNKMK
jgi:phenylacetate-coenzyme A ligase PaaK-like adenylate-forming protein